VRIKVIVTKEHEKKDYEDERVILKEGKEIFK